MAKKKKKDRQNDNVAGRASNAGDKSKRVLKMNGHLLLARNEAAAAILRAAKKEVERNSVPEVKHCKSSMQAFRQFLSFSGLFWKSLFASFKAHTNVDLKAGETSQERVSERFSTAAKYCGKSFVSWIGLLLAELWTILILALDLIFHSIKKFVLWLGFQICRFFKHLKNRAYWKKLQYSIKSRARAEERQIKNAERKAERNEQLAKKREEAEFRKAMKAEEEAFQKAKRKEEEAIRLAKKREEEANKATERIEAELAALALRRKQEEEKVLQETRRKEEAQAALIEARREEEAERVRLEERRRVEEEARLKAEEQEAEAVKRLTQMQETEGERIREAEEQRLALEEARIEAERQEAEAAKRLEKLKEEETERIRQAETERLRLEEQRRIEEEARLEAQRQEAEAVQRLARMQEEEDERIRKAEEERLRLEAEAAAGKEQETLSKAEDELMADKVAAALLDMEFPETQSVSVAQAEDSKEASEEVVKLSETSEPIAEEVNSIDETPVKQKETEVPAASIEDEVKAEEFNTAEEVERQLDHAEEAYLESHRKKRGKKTSAEPAIAASSAHTTVRTMPVHMPTISVPESLDAKELITEARDNTNGMIYSVVKRLELNSSVTSLKDAIMISGAKYAGIGFAMAICSYIGAMRGSETADTPSMGIFLMIFLVITLAGMLLSMGSSSLCGSLIKKKGGSGDELQIIRQNSRYALISGLSYILCALILAFNKQKFVAVLTAVILLSVIGHLMVVQREGKVSKSYCTIIYLLCLLIAAGAAVLLILMFASPLKAIWAGLL